MSTIFVSIPDTVSAALLCIAGYYGNNPERAEKLTEEGYDAQTVQDCVNELFPILEKYQ